MRATFISYRRDNSEGEAGRLFDDLVQEFGEASVFMAVTAIAPGGDSRKALDEPVGSCGSTAQETRVKDRLAAREPGRRFRARFGFHTDH